jgi:hypothetical protein
MSWWAQQQPHPPRPLCSGLRAGFNSWELFGRIDALAADIIACIRSRGDRFESDEQLAEWLAEDGITYTAADLSEALLQLKVSGLLRRPPDSLWYRPIPNGEINLAPYLDNCAKPRGLL